MVQKTLTERFADLAKMGIYCEKVVSVLGTKYNDYIRVRHPLSKLDVKIKNDKLEAYYDKYLAFEGQIDLNFQEWLMLTVYEENNK